MILPDGAPAHMIDLKRERHADCELALLDHDVMDEHVGDLLVGVGHAGEGARGAARAGTAPAEHPRALSAPPPDPAQAARAFSRWLSMAAANPSVSTPMARGRSASCV